MKNFRSILPVALLLSLVRSPLPHTDTAHQTPQRSCQASSADSMRAMRRGPILLPFGDGAVTGR